MSWTQRSVTRDGLLSPVQLSFFAGVMSASVAWWYVYGRSSSRRGSSRENEEDDDASFLRWMNMDDLASRIGELPALPSRRTHWPWDRKERKSPRRSVSPETERPPPSPLPETGSASKRDNKSDFCIGSIFGLDVGGTLAKLVYFEQKSEQADSEFHPLRDRIYRSSASAKAVLLARRGLTANGTAEDAGVVAGHKQPFRSKTLRPASKSSADDLAANTRRLSLPSSPINRRKSRLRHSEDSNDDLQTLYKLRQESVPDDLNAYARSVHIDKLQVHTTESMEDMLKEEKRLRQQQSEMLFRSDGTSRSMRKCKSMFDFSKSRNEALDRFYNFARRLDSYREGVKDHKLSFYSRELGGEFHFIRFETRRMQNAMDLIRTNNLHLNIREMGATGGGAHKFATQWEDELGISMQKQDELDSLVAGMQFVLSTVVGECYTFRPRDGTSHESLGGLSTSNSPASSVSEQHPVGAPLEDDDYFVGGEDISSELDEDRGEGDEWWWSRKVQRDSISDSSTYPYMLVTIGTGVSILRVDGPRKHERVSGSTIGGGTYWGLIRLLTDCEDFEDAMRLVERGDPSKVDMMVGDIYGANSNALEKIGLASDLVASSFGKLVAKEDPAQGLREEDLARALLLMVTINIGQVAYLNAKLHNTQRIYFVGNFLRQNKISQRRLSFAIDYWSKGEMEALFLEHEGYFGALGAFLLSQGVSYSNEGIRSQHSVPASALGRLQTLHERRSTVGSFDT